MTTPSESTPLLDAEGQAPPSRARRAGSWAVKNAVVICISLLITAVLVVIAIFLALSSTSQKSSTKSEVCLTPACVHAASEILYTLSPNYKELDPCTDIEELVCGGWKERHDLREDQASAFTFTLIAENNQMILKHILDAPYPADSKHSSFSPAILAATAQSISSVDQQNFDKLKSGYQACMDENTIKKEGVKPLLKVLQDVYRASSKSSESSYIADTMLYLAELGVSSLVSVGAGADDKDPNTVVVQVSPPWSIGLPAKQYYEDDKLVQKYKRTLAQVIGAIHGTGSNESGEKVAYGVVEFEKKLAAASPDSEDRGDVTKYYNPFSLKEAGLLTPQVKLPEFIHKLAPSDFKAERLIVTFPSYMKALSEILSDTPKDVIEVYFEWKIIQAYSSVVDADETRPYTRFLNELQGKDPDSKPERWRTCIAHVDNGLGWILSRFFVEKAFSAEAKSYGDRIVLDIKERFIETLKKTSWMDKEVVELAIEKVHNLVQKIGYPTKSPDIMDPSTLQNYYATVDISPSTFFENVLSITRFGVSEEWSSLGKPVDKDEWGMTVPTVNAYYNPPGNEIVFPAGIMQAPLFGVDIPQYLSYGAFGAVSGHELSHAFDSTGRHYDQNGNFTDWWTDSTVSAFKGLADCFVEEYGNFTIPGNNGKPLHVNGKLTLGENIADAGGVTAAFAAWQKRRAEKADKDLPGLEHFTQEQLFFISYGGNWCGEIRKEAAITRVLTDPHSPNFARIKGTLSNSKDFLESFNCPSKKPVCELW
jgi:endothelin-converting enzyme